MFHPDRLGMDKSPLENDPDSHHGDTRLQLSFTTTAKVRHDTRPTRFTCADKTYVTTITQLVSTTIQQKTARTFAPDTAKKVQSLRQQRKRKCLMCIYQDNQIPWRGFSIPSSSHRTTGFDPRPFHLGEAHPQFASVRLSQIPRENLRTEHLFRLHGDQLHGMYPPLSV
jgi:hypothetical protein